MCRYDYQVLEEPVMNSDAKSNKNPSRRAFVHDVTVGATGLGAAVSLTQLSNPAPAAAKNEITLEVLDPRGVLSSTEVKGLSNPRVSDLNGKKIALLNENSDLFFNTLEKLLKKAYPTATILRFLSPASPMVPDNTAEVAKACDVWLEGVKTATSSEYDFDVKLEKLGKPGATFSVDSLIRQRKSLAEVNGMPTLRVIPIPARAYLKAKANPELMNAVASEVFESTVKALTEPLTKAEREPVPFSYDYSPKKFAGSSYAEANEKFQQYCSLISWGMVCRSCPQPGKR